MSVKSALRLLDTNKLIDIRYTSLPKGMSRKDFAKKHELPKRDRINIEGKLRLMEEKDCKEVLRLYNLKMKDVGIYTVMSKADIAYYLLPRENKVYTWVIEDPDKPGKLCDFLSMTKFTQLVLNQKEL